MKKTFIVKASSVMLACSILAIFLVPYGFAHRADNGGSKLTAGTTCADKVSVFPASVYTRLTTNLNGSVSGFEIRISNAESDCSTTLFSSNAAESKISLSPHQNSDDMLVALK